MNDQEAYDIAVSGLLRQGKKSMGVDFLCMYRGPGNTKCAAGWLIPDELYNPDMENSNILVVIEDYPEVYEHFSGINHEMLYELQQIHDQEQADHWPKGFRKAAKYYKLASKVVDDYLEQNNVTEKDYIQLRQLLSPA